MDFPQPNEIQGTGFTGSTSCSSSVPPMISNPWEFVPDVLAAKILALLPLSSIYSARGVCKRWRDIVWSPMFHSFMHKRRLSMPLLLEFQQHMYNQAWAYDPEGYQWFHLNFAFVPETAMIVAASYGLVCLGRMAQEGFVIYVCNPMTKAYRKLPPIVRQPDVVMLDVDRQLHSYKVIGLMLRSTLNVGERGSVLVYNRMTDSWKETRRVPEELCGGNLWDVTVSGGMLYCLSTKRHMEVYDIERGFWNPFHYPHQPLARILHLQQLSQRQGSPVLDNSYLCDRKGCLALITCHENLKNIFITKFDPVSRTWRSSHVSAIKGNIFCVGRLSSLTFAMPQTQGHVFLLHPESNGLYNSALKSFQRLPKSPITRCKHEREEILVKGLWFEPRLDTRV